MNKNKTKKQEIYEAAILYKKAGLEVIPNHPTEKYPVGIANWQTRNFTKKELEHYTKEKGWSVGVRNIEGLDFDNNGSPDAKTLLENWKGLVETNYPNLIKRLLIEKTPNGGYHVAWDCEYVGKNQKLAVFQYRLN